MGNAAGRALPYKVGAPVDGLRYAASSVWAVTEGTPTSEPTAAQAPGQALHTNVLIFRLEKKGAAAGDVALAQNALKRMKMLRHPYVLRWLDGGETDDAVAMVTEPAMPLGAWLDATRPRPGASAEARTEFAVACVWGVYTLSTALTFLASCDLLHGGVQPDAVWVTRGGDWKLGGFELCCDAAGGGGGGGDFPDRWFTDNDARGTCPAVFKSPERAAREWGALAGPGGRRLATAIDAFSLGVVLLDVYGVDCGGGAGRGGGPPYRTPEEVRAGAAGVAAPGSPVPPSMRPLLARLLASAPRQRPTFADVLGAEYFRHPLVGALLFLDELALKEPAEKARFFKSLPSLLPRIPQSMALYRVLPALMTALEFGAAGGGGTVVLAPILDIGSRLPPDEYARAIVPCVVRLFASNDRATRLQLLTHLPSYVAKLSDDVLNGSVLGHVASGFTDATPLLREATVKACLHLAPRLTPANVTNVVLKALRRALTDPEPAIRVNATICLGRIAGCVPQAGTERDDGLLPCFLRGMRDPFPPARVAALRAAAYTTGLTAGGAEGGPGALGADAAAAAAGGGGAGYWSVDVVARRLMPAAAYCATDAAPDARAAAFLLLDAGTRVLRADAERRNVEDAAAAAVATSAAAADAAGDGGLGSGGSGGGGGRTAAPASAAAAFASSSSALFGSAMGSVGWAVSSFTSKILPTGAIGGGAAAAAGAAGGAPASTTPQSADDSDGGGAGTAPQRHAAAPAAAQGGRGIRGASAGAAASSHLRHGGRGGGAGGGARAAAAPNDDGWGDDDDGDDGNGWGDDDDDDDDGGGGGGVARGRGYGAGGSATTGGRAVVGASAPSAARAHPPSSSGAPAASAAPRMSSTASSSGGGGSGSSAGSGSGSGGGGGAAPSRAAPALRLQSARKAPPAAAAAGGGGGGDGWGGDFDDDAPAAPASKPLTSKSAAPAAGAASGGLPAKAAPPPADGWGGGDDDDDVGAPLPSVLGAPRGAARGGALGTGTGTSSSGGGSALGLHGARVAPRPAAVPLSSASVPTAAAAPAAAAGRSAAGAAGAGAPAPAPQTRPGAAAVSAAPAPPPAKAKAWDEDW